MSTRALGPLAGIVLLTAITRVAGGTPAELPQTFVTELRAFLALPNDADDPEAMVRNATWLAEAFGNRGFSTRDLSSADYALLYAERSSPGILGHGGE